MTECSSQLSFGFLGRKEIVGGFDGGEISSDGGLLLVREADQGLRVTERLCAHLVDDRQSSKVVHPLLDLLRQRVYQIACGYEDCNDAADLRRDPILKTCVGRRPRTEADLASQPTLSRFENQVSRTQLLRMAASLVEVFVDRHREAPPARILLDVDATDDPTHGQQEFAQFHGYYDTYCYLPLIVTAEVDGGEQELLVAMLRPGCSGAGTHAVPVLSRLVAKLRSAFPAAELIVRADSGFAAPAVYEWCEANEVGYLIGLAKNSRLLTQIEPHLERANACYEETGEKVRQVYAEEYQAGSWDRPRCVLMKAEVTAQGENPRFVVTNLEYEDPEAGYDEYVQRGEAENRIKELKNDLQMDRTSCHRFVANQFRVLLHAAAFVLLSFVREQLAGTRLADAQVCTLQRSLLKLGVRVRETARKVWVSFASSCPVQDLWVPLLLRLRAAAL